MGCVWCVCELLPTYRHLPNDFPTYFFWGGGCKGEGMRKDGEGGRRMEAEAALGDIGPNASQRDPWSTKQSHLASAGI